MNTVKNKRCEVGNYRPVSVLSVISKILERAVYTQLEDYLVKNLCSTSSLVFVVISPRIHV